MDLFEDAEIERVEALEDAGRTPLDVLLAELPPDQREAFAARVIEERDYADIALLFGFSFRVR